MSGSAVDSAALGTGTVEGAVDDAVTVAVAGKDGLAVDDLPKLSTANGDCFGACSASESTTVSYE